MTTKQIAVNGNENMTAEKHGMKLSKTMGEVLYELYGPCASDSVLCVARKSRRMDALLELERHGLVKGTFNGIVQVFTATRGSCLMAAERGLSK